MMKLSVVDVSYAGEAGISALRSVQQELNQATQIEDWEKIRQLDAICANLIEKVIAANQADKSTLVRALSELKGVYANLIIRCHQEMDVLEKVS
jgi:flagellar protein FliT